MGVQWVGGDLPKCHTCCSAAKRDLSAMSCVSRCCASRSLCIEHQHLMLIIIIPPLHKRTLARDQCHAVGLPLAHQTARRILRGIRAGCCWGVSSEQDGACLQAVV